jgi:hypothetical protein
VNPVDRLSPAQLAEAHQRYLERAGRVKLAVETPLHAVGNAQAGYAGYHVRPILKGAEDMEEKRPPNDRGQGRKALPPDERGVQKSIRLTPVLWSQFAELGGLEWLRGAIERAHARKFGGSK